MIEKMGVLWRCKFCGKAAITKGNIQDHAEIHIEGTSHSCHICSKTFSKRNGLKVHISNVHTGRFYCTICGESGMNKQAFMEHKNVHKSELEKKLSFKLRRTSKIFCLPIEFYESAGVKWSTD